MKNPYANIITAKTYGKYIFVYPRIPGRHENAAPDTAANNGNENRMESAG